MRHEATNGDHRSSAVVELLAAETHELRRVVLRDHLANRDVDYPTDHRPGTFHLGVRDARGDVIAAASFTIEAAPGRADRRAVRLRGMAVEPEHQHRGLGTRIMQEAIRRLREDAMELCWANARSSALGFYERLGFEVVSDEFLSVGLPHRVVILDLGV